MAIESGFKHGVAYNEIPTRIVAPITTANPVLAIGTAPIHSASNPAPVNEPVLCSSFSEFVSQFGWSDDFDKYTLCEAAYVTFQLFNVSPLICVNVLDPATHNKTGTKTLNVAGTAPIKITTPIILSTLVIKSGEQTLVAGTDYSAAYDDGVLVLEIKKRNKITNDSVTLTYKEVDTSLITTAEIIGGVDAETGKSRGIECIEDVYPKLAMVPGCLIAPKYSTDSEVAAIMKSKVVSINGCFNAICAVDLDTATVIKYTDCNAVKNNNNLVDNNTLVCWPQVNLGEKKYHLSTQAAALMCQVDYEQGSNIPYVSPSNHNIQCNGACLKDGTPIYLSKAQANYLNGIGIVTALNFSGGWKLWGNRTAIQPSSTDPKDVFLCVRRMIQYLGNSLVLTYFAKTDAPLNKRLITTITDSVQIWLNGLAAQGAILGGEISFDEEDNALTDLIDGHIRFHLNVGFVVPAEYIQFDLEFDTDYLKTLFS